MKKAFLIVAIMMLVSCNTVTTYYQVYKTKSETVKTSSSNALVFEDANCRITYCLWEVNGNAGFSFYNKTNETINLLLDESFYVINGNAHDYYQNRVFITTTNSSLNTTKSSSYSQLGWLSLTNYTSNSITSNSSKGLETTEARQLAIPSKTSKTITEFNINQTVFRDCDLLRYPSSKQTSTKNFTEESTPLKFYNSISYKLADKVNKVKNDFYVSDITNISQNDIFKNEKNKFCNQKGGGTIKVFKDNSPDKFYITYTKTNLDTWKY